MPAIQSARERARAEVTAEILGEARRQLAVDGAAALSLRSVARELGMVSSAVYRYVESRDDLLTRLIIESYDAIGTAAEAADRRAASAAPADRFVAVAAAIRNWAVGHPHEYALVHGSPVPGYAAPGDTIQPAARVPRVLAGIVVDAKASGRLGPVGIPAGRLPGAVVDDAARIQAELVPEVELPVEVVVALVVAWTQLYGFVSFELFGQTKGAVTDHEAWFTVTSRSMAALLGLGDAT